MNKVCKDKDPTMEASDDNVVNKMSVLPNIDYSALNLCSVRFSIKGCNTANNRQMLIRTSGSRESNPISMSTGVLKRNHE